MDSLIKRTPGEITGKLHGPKRDHNMYTTVLDNGLIIKTGLIELDDDVTGGQFATMDPPFPNKCLMVQAACGQVGFGALSSVSAGEQTKDKFKVYQRNEVHVPMFVSYMAIGY